LPAQGAKAWIDGAVNLDGNQTLKYTCLAQRESLKNATLWTSAFSSIGKLFTSQEMKGDTSDLKFETISQNGDRAEVRVRGELRVALAGLADAQQLDEDWLMVFENDTWRWCGTAEEDFRSRLLNTIPTINTFRIRGTKQTIKEDQVVTTQLDFESVYPDKGHGIEKYENDDTYEYIVVDGQACERNNGAPWQCRDGGGGTVGRNMLISIIKGEPAIMATVTKHSSHLDTTAAKPCRLYTNTETSGDITGTFEVCFDVATGYPTQLMITYVVTVAGKTRTLTTEGKISDINAPITITLPKP
jgi:hypothetical protein